MKKIFCIIGRTASGKTSIAKEVANELNLSVLKSYTTRPLRPGEDESTSDHYFISEEEFPAYKEQIVAYTEINDYKYFTTKQHLLQADIYVIDPDGYYYLSQKIKELSMKVVLVPVYIDTPYAVSLARAKKRGDNLEEWDKRYLAEDAQFTVFEHDMADCWRAYVVHNTGFKEAVNQVSNIICVENGFFMQFKDDVTYTLKQIKKRFFRRKHE